MITVECRAGENLLRVAERCGVTVPNAEFCFEGSCCLCEMEVQGGAVEVGYRADTSGADLIRSCICPVPKGRKIVDVNVLSEDNVWGEGVL
ncbi:hypothetical protein R1flu_029016 [Riccia fluitans]|uniref:2Fe-2S ferredoxin-type domain-containing protein n=1 Tax=Riccia fluitans TaxID=41844 RepID=A0ABD1XNZ8_9MARC